jgi:hypothetical protein
MTKHIVKIILVIGVIFPCTSQADLLYCGVHSINTIFIQGDRDDNDAHANNALVVIDGEPCNNSNLIYIGNTSASYNSFLSSLTTAYVTGIRIGIYVNTNETIPGATQIASINFVK